MKVKRMARQRWTFILPLSRRETFADILKVQSAQVCCLLTQLSMNIRRARGKVNAGRTACIKHITVSLPPEVAMALGAQLSALKAPVGNYLVPCMFHAPQQQQRLLAPLTLGY